MGAIPRTATSASLNISLHVHATHAAHVGHAVAVATALLLFHQLRNHRVGGEHQTGYGRGVLQRGASDLGRVDHAHLHQVAELLGLCVEAEVTLVLEHLVEHHRRLGTGVVDDDAQRLFEGFHHDLDAGLLVVVVALELAFLSPAPSMRVVSSLVLSTFLTRPRSFRVTFSSVRPSSSEITVPPVSTAISSSIALRRSPKPGALTASVLRMPRKLLTTSVASASPSTSSATISSGLPAFATCSSSGSRSRIELIFLSHRRT